MKKHLVLIICLCIALPGCVSLGGKTAMDPGPGRARNFNDLSDEDALKMVLKLEEAKPQTEEDGVAKNIALGGYIDELKKRNSSYIAGSGVLRVPYPKEDLKKWALKDLDKMYRALDASMMIYKGVKISDLDEEERALRAIRMTANDAVARERRRRDLSRGILEMSLSTVLVMVQFVLPI